MVSRPPVSLPSRLVTVFLIIGAIGLVLVIGSLIFGELLDGIFGDLDVGVLSTPVIGAFLAAFGFGAALVLYGTSATTAIAALGGLGSGVVVGGAALALTRSLMSMDTDDPVRSLDLVGETGTIITRIPADGLGEVSLAHRGNLLKLGARSSRAVAAGTVVTVTAVTSPSSVVVEPIPSP